MLSNLEYERHALNDIVLPFLSLPHSPIRVYNTPQNQKIKEKFVNTSVNLMSNINMNGTVRVWCVSIAELFVQLNDYTISVDCFVDWYRYGLAFVPFITVYLSAQIVFLK